MGIGGDIKQSSLQGNPHLEESCSNGERLHRIPSCAFNPMLAGTSRENDYPSKKVEDHHSPQNIMNASDTLADPPIERHVTTSEVYSIFTVNQKRAIILTGSLASFFSPLSSSIYYPSLPTIALDLDVSNSQINLTVTTYLVGLSLHSRKYKLDSRFRSSKGLHQ